MLRQAIKDCIGSANTIKLTEIILECSKNHREWDDPSERIQEIIFRDHINTHGDNILLWAVKNNYINIVIELKKYSNHIENMLVIDRFKDAIEASISRNHIEIFYELLYFNTNWDWNYIINELNLSHLFINDEYINTKDHSGCPFHGYYGGEDTLFDWAAKNSNLSMLERLLDNGRLNIEAKPNTINAIKNNFTDIINKSDIIEHRIILLLARKISEYIGIVIYSEKMAIEELKLCFMENPNIILERAELFYQNGFNGIFLTAAEILEPKYPELALEAINKIPRENPSFIDAKYMQANILLSYKEDLLGAYHALDFAGNSHLIVSFRTKILKKLINGNGLDEDILPCKIDISSDTILEMAQEIARLKRPPL